MRGSTGGDFRNTDTAAWRASSDANQQNIRKTERLRILKGMLPAASRMDNPFPSTCIGSLIAAVEAGDYDQ